ncbi:hypothetical protein PoB_006890400 [Plakobranchus ocellatus]|uniref:Uncharacterized protein n=1 Tax=Plakobranchus ocellatus TaxID=259542 RepID=A0AAV4DDX9_9GAST|nr:hypothetical protein PoB_006890400 [Plakobranchus ocellatus]
MLKPVLAYLKNLAKVTGRSVLEQQDPTEISRNLERPFIIFSVLMFFYQSLKLRNGDASTINRQVRKERPGQIEKTPGQFCVGVRLRQINLSKVSSSRGSRREAGAEAGNKIMNSSMPSILGLS